LVCPSLLRRVGEEPRGESQLRPQAPSAARPEQTPAVPDGKTGGVRLARPVAEITLRDIYCAVAADTKTWALRTGIPHRCLVSSNVQGYFEELIDDAQEAILSMLGQRTLLEALTELEIRENAKHQVRNPNRRYAKKSQ